MLTSESEAREKLCPLARIGGDNRVNNARPDGVETIPEPYRCIASKCMAWREVKTSHLKGEAGKAVQGHGYCGLGGPLERF
jgi:hypothetical protein